MNPGTSSFLVPLSLVATLLAAPVYAQQTPAAVHAAETSISPDRIRADVRFLADDLLEGRYPGLRGGELAAKYIATQFALDGLEPAGDDGTYLQQVKFVGMKAVVDKTTFALQPTSGAPIPLRYGEDYTVSDQRLNASADVDAPIVFVGYGVVAPEFGWNDYAGVDVKGKVILCIVGDPPSDDPKFFGGKAMTYYGRWTYKFEEAARQGAIGALIIHRTDLASYGWDVVRNSNTSERTYLADDQNAKLEAASWIQLDVAKQIFTAAGKSLDTEFAAAGKRGFHAEPLPVSLKAHLDNTVRPFQSPNVVGILPGADHGKAGAALYTAHYDHLGFVPGMPGDNIYNGAADNATGSAILLELARTWSNLATTAHLTPPHDVIFSAVTAEEQGLLGSEYLGQHPPVPARAISLDLNFDEILPIGIPEEVNVNGAQRTDFFPTVQSTAREFGLTIVPDPHPEAGGYYRSDHFSLSRVGIPAFSIDPGSKFEGHDLAWGEAEKRDYNEHRYHNFSDNYAPSMNFDGNAKLARFGMDLGWKALNRPAAVEWLHGDEFEAARKRSESQ